MTGSPCPACDPLWPRPRRPGGTEPPACFSDELITDDWSLAKFPTLSEAQFPPGGQRLYNILLTVLLLREKLLV